MILDNHSNNILLISYPSGGFGNFIYHVLTEFFKGTVKVSNQSFGFSQSGNSHATVKYTKIYFKNPTDYSTTVDGEFGPNSKILILCDNGIDDDAYGQIFQTFPNAMLIRTVIDSDVRPAIYQTCIVKAAQSNIIDDTQEQVATHWSDANEPYSIRENFTMLYHNWPFKWQPVDGVINLSLRELISNPVNCFEKLASILQMEIQNRKEFETVCANWLLVNQKFFNIIDIWKDIDSALTSDTEMNLELITDLHTQGYINYCIEKKFNVTIPVYDYRDWFKTTGDILKMVHNVQNKNTNR